jgi:hypothetical protein
MSFFFGFAQLILSLHDCSCLLLTLVRSALQQCLVLQGGYFFPKISVLQDETLLGMHAPLSLHAHAHALQARTPTSCAVRNYCYNVRAVVIFEALNVADHILAIEAGFRFYHDYCQWS